MFAPTIQAQTADGDSAPALRRQGIPTMKTHAIRSFAIHRQEVEAAVIVAVLLLAVIVL